MDRHSASSLRLHSAPFRYPIALALTLLLAAKTSAQERALVNNAELTRIYQEDQAERSAGQKPGPDAARRDRDRLSRVAAIIDAGGAQTGDDFFHAAQVYNHGATADELLRGHILAMAAAVKGSVEARFLAAASLDRYLRAISRPQVFGTQLTRDSAGRPTQEPYDRTMSDLLRRVFDVPGLQEQQRRLLEPTKPPSNR